MTTNKCCEGIDCVPPRFLSKEATHEILGENLCLLIAVGKNGEVVRFSPYGTEETPTEFDCSDEETTDLIEISIKVPKKPESTPVNTLMMAAESPQQSVSAARCLCKIGGVQWYC